MKRNTHRSIMVPHEEYNKFKELKTQEETRTGYKISNIALLSKLVKEGLVAVKKLLKVYFPTSKNHVPHRLRLHLNRRI